MGLAAARVTPPDFQSIRDHLVSHKPPYRTMHLREVRQQAKRRVLRYLHAMHTTSAEPNVIEGMIAGPEVFWHYRLINSRFRTQLSVITEVGPDDQLARIGDRFLIEVFARIADEQKGSDHRPRYLPGQFYLRRKRGGVAPSHATCVQAVKQGVLNAKFVSKLAPWDLELLCP